MELVKECLCLSLCESLSLYLLNTHTHTHTHTHLFTVPWSLLIFLPCLSHCGYEYIELIHSQLILHCVCPGVVAESLQKMNARVCFIQVIKSTRECPTNDIAQ